MLAAESMIRLLNCLFGLDTLLPNQLAVATPEMYRRIDWLDRVNGQKGPLLFLLFIASGQTDRAFVILSELQLSFRLLVLQVGL